MRATTLLKRLLGLKNTTITGFAARDGDLILDARPSLRLPRCSRCGKVLHGVYDSKDKRYWRHLDFGGVRVLLRYGLSRVSCPRCGVVVEAVPWNRDVNARYTEEFEDQVAYHAQRVDKTAVSELMRISWRTVGRVIERVVARKRPGRATEGLERLGVDELSYRKGHHYITLVVDHDGRRVVWGARGKNAATLVTFFKEIDEDARLRITLVTMDMSAAYIKAVREALPHAQIVFDRFHVQKLVSDALDKTRRQEWQKLRGTDESEAVKKLRWPLLKSSWNLRADERERLSRLQKDNGRLCRAYLLKECFFAILDRRQPNVVRKKLQEWLAWASRSRLQEFIRVDRTIRKHLEDIIAYIRYRLTNGLVEGLNNKARLATRRAYGFHSAAAVIAMITLCCTRLDLRPVHKFIQL